MTEAIPSRQLMPSDETTSVPNFADADEKRLLKIHEMVLTNAA
jgi:hypothetical protein